MQVSALSKLISIMVFLFLIRVFQAQHASTTNRRKSISSSKIEDNVSLGEGEWLLASHGEHHPSLSCRTRDKKNDNKEQSPSESSIFLECHATSPKKLNRLLLDSQNMTRMFVIVNVTGAVVCIVFVALIASMLLGFLTLEPLDLRVKIRASVNPDEREHARRLLPIVQQHHRLLVTLLLMNAIFYETLPLFLDNILPSWVAILLSVTILLVFGEILPSAIITGPNQLKLASQLTPLLQCFMWSLYPLVLPLTMLLDCLVPNGKHEGVDGAAPAEEAYHRGELSALVRIQYEDRQQRLQSTMSPHHLTTAADLERNEKETRHSLLTDQEGHADVPSHPPPLQHSEVKLVEGALTMTTKVALDIYTPQRMLFMVHENLELNQAEIAKIYGEGYSRVPVCRTNNDNNNDDRTVIVGILMTRQLILTDWDDRRPVSSLPLYPAPCVSPRTNLADLLKILQQGGSHMALLCTNPNAVPDDDEVPSLDKPLPKEAGFIGIVTLEDVMEAILQDSIYDEEDVADRGLASARLTQWWQRRKRNKAKGNQSHTDDQQVRGSSDSSETTPLV